MIMSNNTFESNDEQATREFIRILSAARPLWNEFLPDPKNHHARGLLAVDDTAYIGDLSLDEARKIIRLVIILRPSHRFGQSELHHLLRFQNRSMGLSSITFDEETHTLQIRSHALLPESDAATTIVREILRDAIEVLNDRDVQDLTS